MDLRNWTKIIKNNIVSKPKHHRDDILKGGLWIGCNHWCGYCPKQQMEWSEAIFKGRNTFFLKITQEQIKGKKIAKNIQKKNITLENIVEVQRKKTSIFRKELVILQVLMIPSIFNPSLEMNWVTFRPKKCTGKRNLEHALAMDWLTFWHKYADKIMNCSEMLCYFVCSVGLFFLLLLFSMSFILL